MTTTCCFFVKNVREHVRPQCIVVYLASESRNSLKLLHAVTSTWALSRLVHSLEENNVDLKMRLIQTHLCSLLALYVALNKPRYVKLVMNV